MTIAAIIQLLTLMSIITSVRSLTQPDAKAIGRRLTDSLRLRRYGHLCEQWARNIRAKWLTYNSPGASLIYSTAQEHDWRKMYDDLMMDCRDCMVSGPQYRSCNYETCQNDRAIYEEHECRCAQHWTGSRCQIPVCLNGWRNTKNASKCDCQPYWTGVACETCDGSPFVCRPANLIRLLTASVFLLLIGGSLSLLCAELCRFPQIVCFCCTIVDSWQWRRSGRAVPTTESMHSDRSLAGSFVEVPVRVSMHTTSIDNTDDVYRPIHTLPPQAYFNCSSAKSNMLICPPISDDDPLLPTRPPQQLMSKQQRLQTILEVEASLRHIGGVDTTNTDISESVTSSQSNVTPIDVEGHVTIMENRL